jgi:glycosyltransferase involved in cell wall biosynthesis
MSSARDEPRVAVVVIGRKEGPRLLRCLDSVWAMDYPKSSLDLIYVDSQSTDDSVDQAKHRNARVSGVNPERPCASTGRNAGWRATDAEFILFLDSDTVLAPTFVRAALAAFDPGMAVVFGNRREMATGQSVYNRVLDLDWVWSLGELDYCGGDALMRRDALVAVDGYGETLIAGEEPDMCGRMRDLDYRILHIDAAMTGHDMDMHTFSQYWRRAMRTGHAYSEVSARFRDTPDQFWTAESNRNFLHAGLLATTPLVGGVAATVTGSVLPLLGGAAFWTAVVARSTKRAGWNQSDVGTRALYAAHSHFQQIPIAVGQINERIRRRNGNRQGLIEYK